MRARLSVGPEDAVTLPPRDAEALGVRPGGEVDVLALRGGFVLVADARRQGGWFGGSLAALSFGEVAQLIASTLRSGVLLLSFGGERDPRAAAPAEPRRKSIAFEEGRVVSASSSDPADRLGPVLWRAGVLARPELDRASRLVAPGRPLGQILVDEGLLTRAEVYDGIARQVREIFLSCFHEREGDFVFREGDHDARSAVKLPERMRELLLTGVKRAEEAERIQASDVPDAGAPLTRVADAGPDLDFRAACLLELADGRPVRAAITDAQLGTFDGLRAVVTLRRAGLVARLDSGSPRGGPAPGVSASTGPAAPEPVAALERYRRAFRRLYVPLLRAEPEAREILNGWLDRLPGPDRAFFAGVRIDADGDLDVARVLANVDASGLLPGAAARARALEALDAFLAFALFEVNELLAPEDADALAREVAAVRAGAA
jgi:hypothetical protein